jgi:alanine racemase
MDPSLFLPDGPERIHANWIHSDAMGSRTRVIIDLGQFEKNVRLVQALLPAGVNLLPVIKANAYGHGLLPVVSSLLRVGIGQVAVMGYDEGCLIRNAGYRGTIVLLGGFNESELQNCLKYNFTPVLHHHDQIRYLEAFLADRVLNIHVKVDSGMGRLGFLAEEIPDVLDRIASLKHVNISGFMTHFPLSEDREDTGLCLQLFREAVRSVINHRSLGHLEVIHMANSAAVMNGFSTWKDPFPIQGNTGGPTFWARPGLLLYGHFPFDPPSGPWNGIRPIMKVEARLLSVRFLSKGQTISYGRTATLLRNSRVGILGMGYADGLPRGISGRGWATIAGKRAPFLGRVCMDMVAVDLTDLPEKISPGDWVSIIDPDLPGSMTIDMLARWMDTIAYEILCQIGHRSERRYIGEALPPSDPF